MTTWIDGHITRERAKVTPALRRAVWDRDGGRCYLCGTYLGSDAPLPYRAWRRLRGRSGPWHLEHPVPLARGGVTSEAACRVACARCNLAKGVRTPGEWRAWRVQRAAHTVLRTAWRLRLPLAAWAVYTVVPDTRPVFDGVADALVATAEAAWQAAVEGWERR